MYIHVKRGKQKEKEFLPGPERNRILRFLQFSKNGARGHRLVRRGVAEVRYTLYTVRHPGGHRQESASVHRGLSGGAGHRRNHTDQKSTALADGWTYHHLKPCGHETAFFDDYAQGRA